MKTWLTINDLSDYLQISETKIRYLMRNKQIPYYDNHGFLRFNRQEIDEWMKTPFVDSKEDTTQHLDEIGDFHYRGRPIKSFILTATKILIGKKPWSRLPDFIKSYVNRVEELKIHDNGRNFMYRKEFSIFINNFNDYLRICCQLGIIEKRKSNGREKEYYPTEFAVMINQTKDSRMIKKIILESILDIVRKKLETFPDERHSVLLLWYFLTLKYMEIEPKENHFRKDEGELKTYFPLIRLNFSKSLCEFLFENDRKEEKKFIEEWSKLIIAPEESGKERGDR